MIATSFALACFAGTVFYGGVYHGNHWRSILLSGALVALIAYLVGSAVGAVLLRCINEQIEQHKQHNPIPGDEPSPAPAPARDLGQASPG